MAIIIYVEKPMNCLYVWFSWGRSSTWITS